MQKLYLHEIVFLSSKTKGWGRGEETKTENMVQFKGIMEDKSGERHKQFVNFCSFFSAVILIDGEGRLVQILPAFTLCVKLHISVLSTATVVLIFCRKLISC